MNSEELDELIKKLFGNTNVHPHITSERIAQAILQGIREGVKHTMPTLNEERIYEVIGQAITESVREFLNKRK